MFLGGDGQHLRSPPGGDVLQTLFPKPSDAGVAPTVSLHCFLFGHLVGSQIGFSFFWRHCYSKQSSLCESPFCHPCRCCRLQIPLFQSNTKTAWSWMASTLISGLVWTQVSAHFTDPLSLPLDKRPCCAKSIYGLST